ncbi:MAG TPA: type II toxin-antitoxin system VapC family toxin [Nocardioidaceae bacterium]|nr:type II toxin-antitoxin system VapC family toxin [Nocardioidaceae bacterium]
MAIVYFDSSAFVKLVVEEEGSDTAATLWDACDAAVSSRLAYVEVHAALAAAGRDHGLDTDAQRQAEAACEVYWAATRPVELTEPIAVHAGKVAAEYALRGADAIHLASALAVGGEELLFAAWDQRLRSGVEAAGMRLAPAARPASEPVQPESPQPE